ncbi:MAG: hypothetical protein ACRBBP_09835 [Bdellovibrionales bacterium]
MHLMKKDFLKTGIFALVVSVVVVFAILEVKKFQGEEEAKEAENRVVDFGSIEIKRLKFNEYILERDGKKFTWKLVSPYTDYLNYRVVEEWVSKGLSQEGRNLSDGGESLTWSEFSLDNDLNKLVYITDEGKEASVQLSEKEAFDGSVYLRVIFKDTDMLYSSSKEWKEVFSKKVEELRSLQLFNWEVPSPSSLPKRISFYKKGRKYLSLDKEETWTSPEFKAWTFDNAKVDSFVNELKTYLHDGFTDGRAQLKDKVATVVLNTDTSEEYSLNFYKDGSAVSSYRPEHKMKVDKNALASLVVEPLDLRSFDDVDGGMPDGDFDALKIKIKDKSQRYAFKDNIWVLGKGEKERASFNGAQVFVFLNKLKEINYKRFVSEKGIVFKSAKKRIYLSKDGKEVLRYSVGPDFQCEATSKRKRCVLIATNVLKKAYVVALKSEINKIFRFKFDEGAK